MGWKELVRRLMGKPEPEPKPTGPPDVEALMALLRRAIAGEEIPDKEVYDVDWRASGQVNKLAREARSDLGRWINDDDIRAKDAEYAANTRGRLEWLLEELEKGVSENRL